MLKTLEFLRLQHWTRTPRAESLSKLLSMFRNQKVTDPRDKVYALLGLATQFGGVADGPLRMFEADYYKNVQQIFKDLVVWHISSYQNLEILAACCGGRSSGEQALPSGWIGGAISSASSGLRRIRVRGTSHTNRFIICHEIIDNCGPYIPRPINLTHLTSN
jgi:hypothetical protein